MTTPAQPPTASTALARSDRSAAVEYTQERVDLLKRTICHDSTNDEFALFLSQCKRTGLDPFARQIHAVKRKGKMTIQVGIDGLRLIAERTGEADGQDGPYWCGEDGVWRDVWVSAERPAAAKVTVYRKGQKHGYTGVATWREYYQPAGGMWDRLPATMLAKVAESVALRKGFPQEMSGLYTADETGTAPDDDRTPQAQQPAPQPATPSAAKPAPDHQNSAANRDEALKAIAGAKTLEELGPISDECARVRKAGTWTDADWEAVKKAGLDRKAELAAPQPHQPPANAAQNVRDGVVRKLLGTDKDLREKYKMGLDQWLGENERRGLTGDEIARNAGAWDQKRVADLYNRVINWMSADIPE